ncbi:hypothetical protein B0H12DRAFT_1328790 [Mycena haematopus]|nr:hypothetical protein B0H12DRAFT_1328790 [Mycena haematopus]
MHRALSIVELVENVCVQLGHGDLVPLQTNAARDLALLARTSTIFLNPALDVLWRSQDGLVNLLKCMPDDLLDIPDIVRENPERGFGRRPPPADPIRIRRPILPTDWERPLFYMCRVKFFSLPSIHRYSEVLDNFGSCLPTETIFPNLEKLYWHEPPLEHLSLFMTPRLANIRLSGADSADFSSVSSYVRKCPGLKTVDLLINVGVYDAAARSSWPFSTIVRGLMHLEELCVPEVDSTALAHLAKLPRLKSLYFAYQDPLEEPLGQSNRSVGFPALTQLGVPSVAAATTLLKFFWKTPLETLIIHNSSCTPMTKMAAWEFYSSLGAHCSHASLLKIVDGGLTYVMEASPEQITTYSVGGDVLQPLFSFTNLHQVELRHTVGFDLDDATILDMARSWPRITALTLEASTTRHMPSRVTLGGLYAFAEHCPRLSSLGITFDATSIPHTPLSGEIRTRQLCFMSLHVYCSPIGDPERVAEFLFSMFPRLRIIHTSYPMAAGTVPEDVFDSHTLWKDVSRRLKALCDGEQVAVAG